MNKVILTGRLVADPELKTTGSGVDVTSFRIAVNQDYVKQGEERKADFFEVVAWRQIAVFICRYFHKGDGIGISGRLQTRTYQAKDGTNRHVVEVLAENVEFPLSKSSSDSRDTYAPPTPQNTTATTMDDFPIDGDFPF